MNELKKIIGTLKNKIQKTKAKIAAVSGVMEESISEVRNPDFLRFHYKFVKIIFSVRCLIQEPKIKIMKTDIKLPKDDEDIKQWLKNVYKKR